MERGKTMTLEQFEEVNAAARTRYTVFDEKGEYVETFNLYLMNEKGKGNHDQVDMFLAYSRLKKYQNETVKYVSFSTVFKALTVTIITKGGNL